LPLSLPRKTTTYLQKFIRCRRRRHPA
jgi:hypothetical protein